MPRVTGTVTSCPPALWRREIAASWDTEAPAGDWGGRQPLPPPRTCVPHQLPLSPAEAPHRVSGCGYGAGGASGPPRAPQKGDRHRHDHWDRRLALWSPPPPGGCSGDSPTQSGKKMRRWEVWGGHPLLFPRCRSPLVALVTARGVSDSPGLGPQKTFLSLLQRDQGHPPSQGPGDISQTSSPATSWFPCGSRWGSEGR